MPGLSKEPVPLKSTASHGNARLKSERYLTVEKYFLCISSASQQLHLTSRCFLGTHIVLPAHCHTAIDSLEEVGRLVQELGEFLHPTVSVAPHTTAPQYAILCMLHIIKERACDLSDLIKSYIPSFKQPHTPFATRQRHYITLSFEVLLQHIADLCLQTGQAGEGEQAHEESIPSPAMLYLAPYREKRARMES
jgi:hypothetical protein